MSHATSKRRAAERTIFERLRYTILAAQREGDRRLTEALAPIGLTTSQAEVLRVLQDRDGLTLRELGEHLVCERGSPSRLVKTLKESALISSASDLHDGRSTRLRLTVRGLKVAVQVQAIESAFYEALQEALSVTEVSALADHLEVLLRGTTAHAALKRRCLVAHSGEAH